MATIDETIKNYIEMLSCEVDSSDEKGDSQQETQSLLDFHLWCLLQNKGLIEIVKEYLALSDEGKLDFAYEKVFTCGVRLIDFQYVIYRLFGEGESDFNEFLLLQTDFSLVHKETAVPYPKEIKKYKNSVFNYIFIPQELNRIVLKNYYINKKLDLLSDKMDEINCAYSQMVINCANNKFSKLKFCESGMIDVEAMNYYYKYSFKGEYIKFAMEIIDHLTSRLIAISD